VGKSGFAGPANCSGGFFGNSYNCGSACNFAVTSCLIYWQDGLLSVGNYLYSNNTDCQNSNTSTFYCPYSYAYISAAGCVYFSAGGYIYQISACSDRKIKTDIETIENGLELLLQLEPVEFDWNETFYQIKTGWPEEKKHSVGFIAQEVEKILPEVVSISKDNGYYVLDYPKLNAILVEGIKKHQLFIEDINNQITELENKLK
jgi:hypothetical protein